MRNPIDKRWLPVVEDIYRWHHQNERYFRNHGSLARAAMVYSQQTATFSGGEKARAKVEDHTLGFYQALVEARIPFDMVHDRLLDSAHLNRYKTLILPNIAALSDLQCSHIREFVSRGGNIVATHETSLYDEMGTRRPDFGLANLFGASFAGRIEQHMMNSYLALDPSASTRGLLTGFEDAGKIINGVNRVHVRANGGTVRAPLTVIPSYPDLPMESVYERPFPTRDPAVYLREIGRGRVVYFPWDIDRTLWEILDAAHGKLLRNSVLWATNEPPPVTIAGKGLLDVSVWTQTDSMTVHLVNLTNPMMMKGPVREIMPSPPQKVSIRVADSKRVKSVHLLVAGHPASHRKSGERIEVDVPSIEVNEVIALDFA